MRNYNTRTSPGGGVAHHSIDSISNVYNIQHISNNICIILGPNTYYLNIHYHSGDYHYFYHIDIHIIDIKHAQLHHH